MVAMLELYQLCGDVFQHSRQCVSDQALPSSSFGRAPSAQQPCFGRAPSAQQCTALLTPGSRVSGPAKQQSKT